MLLKTYSKKNMVKVCHGGNLRKPDTVTTYRRRDDVLVITSADGQFVLPFEDVFYAVKMLKSMNQKEKNEKPSAFTTTMAGGEK